MVAVARKLAVLLHRLWVSGEVYEPLYITLVMYGGSILLRGDPLLLGGSVVLRLR
jgi:hypothetical protein